MSLILLKAWMTPHPVRTNVSKLPVRNVGGKYFYNTALKFKTYRYDMYSFTLTDNKALNFDTFLN